MALSVFAGGVASVAEPDSQPTHVESLAPQSQTRLGLSLNLGVWPPVAAA